MSGHLFQGMSETFETLHNLVHKGVKVVMDIPYELWNETSAEVADLKKQVRAPRPSEAAVPHRAGWGRGLGRGRPRGAGGTVVKSFHPSGFSLLGNQPPAWWAAGLSGAPLREVSAGLCQRKALWLTVRRAGGGV